MKIPSQYNKWIVFGLSFVLSRIHYVPRHSVYFDPLHRPPTDRWLDSVVIATLITISYVIWSAMGRWLSHRALRSWISQNVRALTNATFFVLIVVAICLPWPPSYTATGRVLIPSPAAHPTK
jgi:hypothetical protein